MTVDVGVAAIGRLLFGLACTTRIVFGQDIVHDTPLDPQAKVFASMASASGQADWDSIGAVEARKGFNGMKNLFGEGPTNIKARDTKLDERIPVRIYRPQAVADDVVLSTVLFFHGGGWVVGNLETHDALCRRLCDQSQCMLISVDYRLAPENPFPAALDDCYDATLYVAQHADALKARVDRLIVAGDSAGGNLAAAVALKARNEKSPAIGGQILIYPVLDEMRQSQSYTDFATGYGLTKLDMEWFWKQYTQGNSRGAYASPLQADSLEGLPPTFILTAQYDVLRDEGEAYAARLRSAGVDVRLHRYGGMTHGFLHFATAFKQSQQASIEIAEQIRRFANSN